MASPLSTLRKYQFAFFVFFGVVCMLVFVIGDPLDTWLRSRSSSGRRSENKVVVSWRGGELREDEIGYTQSVRNVIREFIRTLLEETQKKNGVPRVQVLSLSPGEEDIVYTHLLAQRAKAMGMVVSDETALIYLEQLTATLIPRSGIGSIFQETVGGRITEQQLLGEIKSELLAQNYLSLTYPDLTQGQLPVQAWEYHRRLHRRVQAEVVPVNVSDFTSKVTKQPSDAEIESLYAAAKDRYPDPASPEPGFRRHRKAAFEFVRVDRKKFEDEETAKLKPDVTEQEIQGYYDKNKEEFRISDAPPEQPKPESPKPDSPNPENAKPDSEKSEGTKPDGEKPTAPEKSTVKSAPAAEPAKPESTKPDDAKPQDKKEESSDSKEKKSDPGANPSEEKPVEKNAEPPADPAKSKDGEPKAECGGEQDVNKSEEKPADPATPPAAKKESTEAASAEQTEKKSEEPPPPGDKKSAPEKSAPAKEEPKESPPASDAAPAPEKPTATPPAAPTRPEPKYKPLDDKLKEEIREKIARQKAAQAAQQRIDKAFDEVKRGIEKYARDKRSAELTSKPAPQPIDLAKLAESHGMTSGRLALADPKKIQESELGKTRGFDFSSMNFEAIPFHVLAYRDGISLWKPDQIRGSTVEGNPDAEFLYWKTAEEEPFVPELKDIRSEVVDAWKLREALALAQAEAKSLADKAKESGKPLKEVFADNKNVKVAETNLFSWMTRGFLPANMGGAPSLSSVDHVEFAGQEFMRAVFQLKSGEVGTAINQPRMIAYVVRIERESPSEDDLRAQFLQSGTSTELQQVAMMDRIEVRRSWFEALRREMDLKWERTPQS